MSESQITKQKSGKYVRMRHNAVFKFIAFVVCYSALYNVLFVGVLGEYESSQ